MSQTFINASELRRAFDQSFALPPSPSAAATEKLLCIRIADEPYALRVTEIEKLVGGSTITAVPGDSPGLLGVAAIQGRFVAAYSLAALLGYSSAPGDMRWLAVCGKAQPVGLAFAHFEHQFAVPQSSFDVLSPKHLPLKFSTVIFDKEAVSRPVIHLSYLLSQILGRVKTQPENSKT
jgi:chemotaxis signal transduction protein